MKIMIPKRASKNILGLFIFSLLFVTPIRAVEVTKDQVYAVGKELACLCGTCPQRPLDECTCGYAQQQRDRITSMLTSGQSSQAVIDAFISEFGKEVLSQPPAEGFNLTAWLMPPIVLLIGLLVVKSVLRSWGKTQPATVSATPIGQDQNNDPYLDRLENDLKERDQ